MPLYMIHEDITRMAVDAIVDPTDCWFSGSGGTDFAIHRAAGPGLREELQSCPALEVGEAVITSGHDLPAKYVIHTFGPIWEGGDCKEAEFLAQCYRNCLRLAKANDCRSVAFPVISGGTFGFPNDDALKIAENVISDHLQDSEMTVYIVAYQSHVFNLGAKLFSDVAKFVGEHYIEIDAVVQERENAEALPCETVASEGLPDLDEMLKQRGESFSCMLDRLRDERGMTGPALYKKAWIHKSVYSKIMNNINYQPAKVTAIAFGLALELPWASFGELLGSAGYALTRTSKFDTVIEYFVRQKKYDIEEINSVLYELDPELPLIGV